MAAKVANPTANIFAVLAEVGTDPVDVHAPVKKEKKAKPAGTAASTNTVPTPAEKARAREAAKAAAPPAPAKPPKAERPAAAAPVARSAPVGGRPAGPSRPARGGLGARRAKDAQPHRHEPPAHGRPQDRQSQGKYSRNPPAKKGGAGKGNWGTEKDTLVGRETAALVDGWGDTAPNASASVSLAEGEEKKQVKEGGADATVGKTEETKGSDAETTEEPDNTRTLDDYLKEREAAAAALAAKVGVIEPRKLENVDLTGAVEDVKRSAAEEKKEKKETPATRKGEKFVDVTAVLQVRPAERERSERGRGRGRGGGRGARGGRAEAAAPARQGGQQRGRRLDVNSQRQFPSLGQ